MRILHLVAGYGPVAGSAARWCSGVATALVAAGHEVTVLTLATPDDTISWGRHDLDAGVDIRRCASSPALWTFWRMRGARRGGPPSRSVELRATLLDAVRAAEVVHVHGGTMPEARWTRLVCRALRRPLVVTPALGEPVPRLATRADAVVVLAAGEVGRAGAVGVPAARIVVAGTGRCARLGPEIGTPGASGTGAAERSIVLPGPGGALALVDATRVLRLDGWPLVPVIVGDMGASADRVRRLWQAGAVPVEEVPVVSASVWETLLDRAAVVVLPPRWDPAVVHDAWAVGTPVLAPDGDAAALLGAAAVRFPSGDPLALARELVRLLGDPVAVRQLVERGRARVAAVPPWSEVAACVAQVYVDLVARRGAPARWRAADEPRGAAGSTT